MKHGLIHRAIRWLFCSNHCSETGSNWSMHIRLYYDRMSEWVCILPVRRSESVRFRVAACWTREPLSS